MVNKPIPVVLMPPDTVDDGSVLVREIGLVPAGMLGAVPVALAEWVVL